MSAGVGRPLVGMHFFNPAPVMKLVEIVSGLHTPPELAEKVSAIARDIGKTSVQIKDSAAFYEDMRDTKYRAHPLLLRMVRGGLLGRKTGKGFCSY